MVSLMKVLYAFQIRFYSYTHGNYCQTRYTKKSITKGEYQPSQQTHPHLQGLSQKLASALYDR